MASLLSAGPVLFAGPGRSQPPRMVDGSDRLRLSGAWPSLLPPRDDVNENIGQHVHRITLHQHDTTNHSTILHRCICALSLHTSSHRKYTMTSHSSMTIPAEPS